MPLQGIKVLEFVGLAPAPFCGKILADFGATVTRIDKTHSNQLDVMQHGKRTIALNLKHPKAQLLVRRLVRNYDVLLEPFRAGVMEKLNLGPKLLCKEQPRLIYARLSGFGQSGHLAPRAGHDINYAAISGVLSMLGRHNEKPTAPVNLLADFAGGGLMCALGICLALLARHRSGVGQIVDAAMVDGAAYVASWLFMSRSLPIWGGDRGMNILDSGAFFYDTYETKDGKYMSVGALEPQFFDTFKERLGVPHLTQFSSDSEQVKAKDLVRDAFLTKTQAEWTELFQDVDACVYPVLAWTEAAQYTHNKDRENFQTIDGMIVPTPAPHLSKTPGKIRFRESHKTDAMAEAREILKELNLSEVELQQLIAEHILLVPINKTKL